MGMKNEKELVESILGGSEEALRIFYDECKPKLTNFIRLRVSNEKDVEELTQDTFMAALEAFRDFTYRSSVYTFLCAIAKRKVIDFYRRKKLKRIIFSQIPAIEPLLSILTTPEDKLDEKLLAQKIEKTLDALSPQYKRLLQLKYIEGWSVTRIAEEMTMSFKSAESKLFRARQAFVTVYTQE
ncbi:MAG: RNA polymerase sigma factor [Candidatus Roizmanbacteria bacterium]|nr:RNA polymerase sigma factor [Candidatus Roizmanbacteria bacterium]